MAHNTNFSIPVMKASPYWSNSFADQLHEIWRSGQFSNFGRQVDILERVFAKKMKVDASQVVSVANATLGISGALQTSHRRKWLMPSWTFAATAHSALMAGIQPLLVDVDEATWMNRHMKTQNSDSGALLVLPFGAGLGSFDWGDDADVVIDAAASIAARIPDLSTLPKRTSIVFSLHATKILGVGEGGIAVFGTIEAAERFRSWTNFGFNGHRESEFPASNAKMSEIIAGLNFLQFEQWDPILDSWRSARLKMNLMAESVGLKTFSPLTEEASPYFIAIFEDQSERDRAETLLREDGVQTRRWWGQGVHGMPAFQKLAREPMTVTENISSKYLGLPLFPELTADQASQIATSLERL